MYREFYVYGYGDINIAGAMNREAGEFDEDIKELTIAYRENPKDQKLITIRNLQILLTD